MAELPNLGTPMYLVASEAANFRSRLEAVDGDTLSVAAPLETSGPDAPQPGEVIDIFWAQPRARMILPCKLVRIADSAPFQWVLQPIGDPKASNRREFVRGGGGVDVRLGAESEEGQVNQLDGRLIDISEGGVRCWVPAAQGSRVGDRMLISVQLDTGGLEVEGLIHTVRPAFDEPGDHLILTFQSDDRTAQLIRQHVFSWEIAERRRAADT